MKTLSLIAIVLTLGLTSLAGDADAASKRFGAGRSAGMQRQSTAIDKAPAVAPAQAPTAASAAAKAQPGVAAPQTPPKRSWMGPLAGLAAGLGLAALASHFGFGEGLASMLMIGLLVMAAIAAIGFIMRRRAAASRPAAMNVGGMQYAAAPSDGSPENHRPYEVSMPAASGSSAPVVAARNIPADFDVAGFVRNAKLNFIRLQAANDAGNLDDIRQFTTPEMFAEIKLGLAERGATAQETDVVSLEADVVEVVEEESRYVVSVRFNGLIREQKDSAAEPFDEMWHLIKPRSGGSGWVVAGIQQIQ